MNPQKILLCLLLAILLTGCINIDVDHRLKRNGHYDMDLTISTGKEYKMMLNSLKSGFDVHDSVKDKFRYSETETSVTYSFRDLEPDKDHTLFNEVENEQLKSQDTPDSSFLNPDNIEFTKKFDFPYYRFNYTLKIAPTAEESASTTLSADQYIIDDANLLDHQTELAIIESINKIYQNDSVETIVMTKKRMEPSDYLKFKFDFTGDFQFKKTNAQYVMLFVSTNQGGPCKIESNLYMNPEISSEIIALNTDFKNTCRSSSGIVDAVKSLEDIFEKNDLSTSKIQQQMNEMFKIGYTVQVFGDIVDTNGLKMEGDKVKFDINPTKPGTYNIIFKDFFLASMLGSAFWIYMSALILIAVVGIAYFVMHKKSKSPEAPLAVNPQLLQYVKKARNSGLTDDQIKLRLTQGGWNTKDVDIALGL